MQRSSRLFDVQEAAEFLGVNAGTIRRWAQDKQLYGIKIGSRGDWRFTEDALSKMISESKRVSLAPHSDWSKMSESKHFVQFYETDDFILKSVKEFITSGDSAIVVATKDHRNRLELLEGTLPSAYIALDAAETLDKFMIDGLPDAKLFYMVLEDIISQASHNGGRLRVFGEMVALLWAEGNQPGAVQLEKLWNDLQKNYSFSLFCAYPIHGFGGNIHTLSFTEICTEHARVLPSESYAAVNSSDERLRVIALLQQKARSLEAEVDKRKRLERQKDEFMGIVSHELKTPVTSLKAFTQVLRNKFKTKGDIKSVEYLGKMDGQINKLTTLIEDLLDVTKIEGGKLRFRTDYFNIDEVADEIIEEIQRTAGNHKIIKQGAAKKKIYGDRYRIGQVLTNLLTNAIKYSPGADKVIVNVVSDKKEITVSVQDFGVGITKNDQQFVFERFYRVSDLKQETFPGLGLGLYISSQIINRHQGKLWVESEKGKGSTFYFTLPYKTITT